MNLNATFLVELGIFGAFYLFVKKSLWPLFAGVLEEREAVIEKGLESAREGQMLLAKAQEESCRLIHEARSKSKIILENTEKELDALKSEHKRELEQLRFEAHKQMLIEQDRHREAFMKEAQAHYLEVAEALISKLLVQNVPGSQDALTQALGTIRPEIVSSGE